MATTATGSCTGSGGGGSPALAEIGDDVGAVGRIVETGERHPVAGDEATRIGQEGIEVGFGPDDPGARQRRGVGEAGHCARRTADDADQMGADPVDPLLDLMAGGAPAKDLRAALGISGAGAFGDRCRQG